jgi:hypothetical protein
MSADLTGGGGGGGGGNVPFHRTSHFPKHDKYILSEREREREIDRKREKEM